MKNIIMNWYKNIKISQNISYWLQQHGDAVPELISIMYKLLVERKPIHTSEIPSELVELEKHDGLFDATIIPLHYKVCTNESTAENALNCAIAKLLAFLPQDVVNAMYEPNKFYENTIQHYGLD